MSKIKGGYATGSRIVAAEMLLKRAKRWNKHNKPSPYDLSSGPAAVENAKRLLDKHGIRY